MIDIFDFIDSKDIKEYLKSIDYQFDALTASWVVWQSRNATYEEKQQAFDEIIKTMPDCEIPERLNTTARKSLHKYLKEIGNTDYCDLDGLWFYFPTPFKKGDILTFSGEIFVLGELCYENGFRERLEKNGDSSDMTAYGYFIDADGDIIYECMHRYMDLEYYKGELKGTKRMLKAISSFIKDEISLEGYSFAYRKILMENLSEKADKAKNRFTEEGLNLMGVK